MESKIKFIINKSEITAGTRGASLGPEAVKVAARSQGKTLFGDYPSYELEDSNALLDQAPNLPFAKYIEGTIQVYKNLEKALVHCAEENQLPIVLAGDHGSAGGTIAGLKAAYPNKRIGVLWIDAHGDIHTPYTTPSGNIHGMPVAAALNIDNLDCQRNQLDEVTKERWEELKAIGGKGAKMATDDLIYVAVRDTEPEEDHAIEALNIRSIKVAEIREKGIEAICKEVVEKLAACDLIYISFDVDSMDPKETSYGTGTPVENGLFIDEAKALIQCVVKLPNFGCFEMVEINPCLDEKKNKMAEVSLSVLEDVIESLKK